MNIKLRLLIVVAFLNFLTLFIIMFKRSGFSGISVKNTPCGNMSVRHLWFFERNKTITRMIDTLNLPLFPKEDPQSDRIINQLLYIPPGYNKSMSENNYKTIYADDTITIPESGNSSFKRCPVSTCQFVNDLNSDLIISKFTPRTIKTKKEQIQMIYLLESPFHTGRLMGKFDWTATYRRDSDIVGPYGKWVYYEERIKRKKQKTNYAKNKTKMVAWFASNCQTKNNRLEIARELQTYISVDIYGDCGNLTCSRTEKDKCAQILKRDYKFYLSFENSNCRDYITEKLFENAFENDIIPVVMGGRIEDYQHMTPERSFIHVDEFQSIKHLADYLTLLDADDVLYNSYFEWKGTGEFINTYHWCRICAMLHVPNLNRRLFSLYESTIQNWWSGEEVCQRNKTNSLA